MVLAMRYRMDMTFDVLVSYADSVDRAILGRDVRRAVKAYRILPEEEYDKSPDIATILAGGKDKFAAFSKILGVVGILHKETDSTIIVDAWKSTPVSKSPIKDAKVFYPDSCSDEQLGNAVFQLLQVSLEAGGVKKTAAKKKAIKPTSDVKDKSPEAANLDHKQKSLVDKLEALGFFAFDDKPEKEIQRIRRSGYEALVTCKSNRVLLTDPEDLAEGGVGALMAKLEQFFDAMNIELPEVTDELGEDRYFVNIDGKVHPILTPKDFKDERSKPGLLWGKAAYRTADAINGLLKKAKLKERIYAYGSDNYLCYLLLTPEMFNAIIKDSSYDATDGLFEIKDEYPGFGRNA